MRRALAIVATLCVLAAPIQAGPSPVAHLVAIDGKVLVMSGNAAWKSATLNQADYLGDHLKTDGSSLAALEFTVGGKIGLNEGTEIEITGARDVQDVTQRDATSTLVLKAGTIWAKFTKQQEQFKIQTESTTIGIRGTEFVVEDDGGETTVSVLEGLVDVADAQGIMQAAPGDVVAVRRGQRAQRRQYKVDDLRKKMDGKRGRLSRFFQAHLRKGPGARPKQGPGAKAGPTPIVRPPPRRTPFPKRQR